MQVDAMQWKQMIAGSMDVARQRGDISNFWNIEISVESETATVKADRYSELKCFNDERYYMVLERNDRDEIAIVYRSMPIHLWLTSPQMKSP